MTEPRLSVQLYSLRHMPDLDRQLALVAETGLRSVELTSSNFDKEDALEKALDEHGLEAPSGHVGIERLTVGFDRTVATALRFETRLLVLWGLPEDEQPRTADAWRVAGARLGTIAESLARHELAFAFHNHDWELEQFENGKIGLDLLFEGAGSSPLKWQADLAWLARGGADVSAIANRHATRLVSAHVKDLAAPDQRDDEDGWADLGHGVLPWPDWLRLLGDVGVDLLVLEHDEPSDPARFLRNSAASFRGFSNL